MNLLQQIAQPEASEERPAYLGFTAEDTSIFASAEVEIRKNNPIETRTKKRKVDEEECQEQLTRGHQQVGIARVHGEESERILGGNQVMLRYDRHQFVVEERASEIDAQNLQ